MGGFLLTHDLLSSHEEWQMEKLTPMMKFLGMWSLERNGFVGVRALRVFAAGTPGMTFVSHCLSGFLGRVPEDDFGGGGVMRGS